MFEKIILTAINVISVIVYVCLLCFILSIPVFLIVQAQKDPEFTVYSSDISEVSQDDAYLASVGEESGGWYKIEYTCSASSGKYSPYSFRVGSFALKEANEFKRNHKYYVVLDEPLDFSGQSPDDFTLTLYVNADEQTATELMNSASFGTMQVSRYYSMFEKEITMYVPGFSVAECRADT